jgi:hypothetical protein
VPVSTVGPLSGPAAPKDVSKRPVPSERTLPPGALVLRGDPRGSEGRSMRYPASGLPRTHIRRSSQNPYLLRASVNRFLVDALDLAGWHHNLVRKSPKVRSGYIVCRGPSRKVLRYIRMDTPHPSHALDPANRWQRRARTGGQWVGLARLHDPSAVR